jgi:TfoX/Sxy family transcriptional regulator of competence genes
MASAKVIAAAEALLAALKADTPAAAAPTGNRTTAVTNYRAGSNPVQDVVDCLRRAIRKSEEGTDLTAKERNVMRKSIKALKATRRHGIVNTNGVDYLTQNHV